MVATIIGLLTGDVFLLNEDYSLFGRLFYFWPFFLIGVLIGRDNDALSILKKLPKAIWVLALMVLPIILWNFHGMDEALLYGNRTYANLDMTMQDGMTTRLMIYGISLLTCAAFFGALPKKLAVPSYWKTNTLYAYLWHGVALKTALAFGFVSLALTLSGLYFYGLLIMTASLMTMIFSSQIVKYLTDKALLNPLRSFKKLP